MPSSSNTRQKVSEFERAYLAYATDVDDFRWSDKMLYDSQIFRITDELYDTEVYQKEGDSPFPWIVVFTKDRFNKEHNQSWNRLNGHLF